MHCEQMIMTRMSISKPRGAGGTRGNEDQISIPGVPCAPRDYNAVGDQFRGTAPAVSPDGKLILVERMDPSTKRSQMVTMSAEGGTVTTV